MRWRNASASATCTRRTTGVRAKSAISVRATRSTRVKPRAESRIFSAASSASDLASGSNSIALASASAFRPPRRRCAVRASATRAATAVLGSPGGARDRLHGRHRLHLDRHVDPVQQRAADAVEVILAAARRLAALAGRIAQMAAPARVHRRDQLEPRRVGDVGGGPRDGGSAGFDGLAQRLQRLAGEFRQLVQEQHAPMRQADLAGPCAGAAAGQCRLAGRMMRLAIGRPLHQPPALHQPGDRVDHAHFERLGRRQIRQQAGQPAGEHGFARAGRADQQQVMRHRRPRPRSRGARSPSPSRRSGPGRARPPRSRRVRAASAPATRGNG